MALGDRFVDFVERSTASCQYVRFNLSVKEVSTLLQLDPKTEIFENVSGYGHSATGDFFREMPWDVHEVVRSVDIRYHLKMIPNFSEKGSDTVRRC